MHVSHLPGWGNGREGDEISTPELAGQVQMQAFWLLSQTSVVQWAESESAVLSSLSL